jgi:hypothetical protein
VTSWHFSGPPVMNSNDQDAAIMKFWWNSNTRITVIVDRKLRSRITANEILKDAGLPKAI